MNWLKYKKIYFSISILLILMSLYGIFSWGFDLSIDFTGGSVIEIKGDEKSDARKLEEILKEGGMNPSSVQATGDNNYLLKFKSFTEEERGKLKELYSGIGEYKEIRFENVGPSIAPELIKKTIVAIAVSASAILLWVAIQFKNYKYGISAILAMLHDSFILIGSFSLLGHFLDVEVDFLFVTALLTTLSFSVHDTIVVFDRIREILKKESLSEENLEAVSNKALSETMVRSLNNSFTIIFMLFALIILGGDTIKWFAVSLLIGTVLGTYSSPFVAVPILVTWDKFKKLTD